jgi:hypothetical protein
VGAHAVRAREQRLDAAGDALVEVAERLAAGRHAVPPLLEVAGAGAGEELSDLFAGAPLEAGSRSSSSHEQHSNSIPSRSSTGAAVWIARSSVLV